LCRCVKRKSLAGIVIKLIGIHDHQLGRHGDSLGKIGGYGVVEVTIICRKIYWQDFERYNIPQEAVERFYLEGERK